MGDERWGKWVKLCAIHQSPSLSSWVQITTWTIHPHPNPPPPSVEQLSSTNWSLVPIKVGDCWYYLIMWQNFSSVQLLRFVRLFVTPWTAAHKASQCTTNPRSLLKLMSIKSAMLSNHLILSWPLLLPPSIFPSIRGFFNESALCSKWPKYWSFSISPSNEYLGLISFRIDWFDLLEVQGTLKSLLQHHGLKA